MIIGSSDPNPLVSGKGIRILKEHGIEVTENVLKEECDKLNEAFFYYIQNQKPYVVMKYAMTMDGKIATYTGASRWVTGEAARMHVQKQRYYLLFSIQIMRLIKNIRLIIGLKEILKFVENRP